MLPAAVPLGIGSGIQWPLLGMAITINRYPARCQFQVVQDITHARRHKPCPAHHRIPFLQLSVLANERLLLLASRPIRIRYDKLHAQSMSLLRSCPDLPPLAISALFISSPMLGIFLLHDQRTWLVARPVLSLESSAAKTTASLLSYQACHEFCVEAKQSLAVARSTAPKTTQDLTKHPERLQMMPPCSTVYSLIGNHAGGTRLKHAMVVESVPPWHGHQLTLASQGTDPADCGTSRSALWPMHTM